MILPQQWTSWQGTTDEPYLLKPSTIRDLNSGLGGFKSGDLCGRVVTSSVLCLEMESSRLASDVYFTSNYFRVYFYEDDAPATKLRTQSTAQGKQSAKGD
jgi:hypothetical protein